jgi:hypothetical protein
MRIAFITTVDRNPGDAFIRAGIEYLLQQLVPLYRAYYFDKHDIRSIDKNWRYLSSHPESVQRLLRPYLRVADKRGELFDMADIIIQAGTPFYYIIPGPDGTFAKFSSSATTDWIQEAWMNRLLSRHYRAAVMNLAVGTCQPFFSDSSEFDRSPELLEFVARTVKRACLTTVRDPVAMRLMERLQLSAHCLPCTAIFAPDFHHVFPEEPTFVAMNYMRGGAHYDLGQKLDLDGWERTFLALHHELSARYRVILMCNSASEVTHARSLLPDAETFFSARYEDYLWMYARARFGVFNRVHAGVALSGLGRPSVVVGNDTRARMAELMGLPTYFVNAAGFDEIMKQVASFETQRDRWRTDLEQRKEDARSRYLRVVRAAIEPVIAGLSASAGYQRSGYDKVWTND